MPCAITCESILGLTFVQQDKEKLEVDIKQALDKQKTEHKKKVLSFTQPLGRGDQE